MKRDCSINRMVRDFIQKNDKKSCAIADKAGIRRDTFSRIINCQRPIYVDGKRAEYIGRGNWEDCSWFRSGELDAGPLPRRWAFGEPFNWCHEYGNGYSERFILMNVL